MFRNPNNFDKYLDEATDAYRLEIDWQIILKICDLIRQGDVNPKTALSAIQKKISHSDSHVAYYGLIVLESCVKNCGALIQNEISTKQFMEQLKEIIKTCPHENVKTKGLDLLQSWAFAFRNISKYRPVYDTVTIMKAEGYKFPVFKESDAMFTADIAPEWEDGDRCHRCRVMFSMLLRKHHCRACGQVFCQQCSSHTSTLPKFGIEKEVRVCESCYEKYKSGAPSIGSLKTEELPSEYLTSSLAQQNQLAPPKKTEEELNEEEELQLAIALSQSEAELKRLSSSRSVTRSESFSPPMLQKFNQFENEDSELSRYLNRSYWENRVNSVDKSCEREEKHVSNINKQNVDLSLMKSEENGLESEDEIEEFMNALRNQVEIFVNRMKSNSSRGRSISNDSSVQTLFLNITAMHSKLLKYIQQQDDKRVYFEGLQDKLTQVKDARAALDALREEHKERLRREAEIAERQRQLQMAQKLEIMRQKKQEYLQYQRQLALQRIHDQERELHLRQEQQKQQYRIGSGYGTAPYMVSAQGGGISAFEPVTSMGMNINNLPPVTVSAGPFVSSQYPGPYSQVQNVSSVVSPPQQQMTQPPSSSSMMIGQSQMPPPSTYVPVNHTSVTANHSNPSHIPLGSGQQAPQFPLNQQSIMHQANHLKINAQPQSVHVDPQNPHQMIPPSGVRIEQNPHVMGPPLGVQQQPQIIQHPSIIRPMMPSSSSPLSSPSSSSEHSLNQLGSQPVPSAPSATSTPQPEEKEEVAELISFD
ncbi:hypothetical protein PGB90_007040 [Kerria lacca]